MSQPTLQTNLDGQVALVTGATSGLGRRFAYLIADCGAKVALAGRRVERLEEVAAEIETRGGTAVPLPLDMTDDEAVKAAPSRAEELLGAPVQILINNAGVPDAQRAHLPGHRLTGRTKHASYPTSVVATLASAPRLRRS